MATKKANVENPSALKHLFDVALMKRMALALTRAGEDFDRRLFLQNSEALLELEMKNRVRFIRDRLRAALPQKYKTALGLLLKHLVRSANGVSGFALWPLSEFVQTYGVADLLELRKEGKSRQFAVDLKLSLDALAELTPIFSSEFAVRPFLIQFEDETLEYLLNQARSKDTDLRRWASEGSRPRLPWGERLSRFVENPKATSQILEALKFDPELYVRKSVANHLNDIAKDHPEWVITCLKRWKKEAAAASASEDHLKNINWIARHSLRTLIKQGSPGALALIGIAPAQGISVHKLQVTPLIVKIGKSFDFEFEIRSAFKNEQRLVIDYIIHFARTGGRQNQKVFKLKTCAIESNSKLSLKKTHSLKPITTRNYYPGRHLIEIQINGTILARAPFDLKK